MSSHIYFRPTLLYLRIDTNYLLVAEKGSVYNQMKSHMTSKPVLLQLVQTCFQGNVSWDRDQVLFLKGSFKDEELDCVYFNKYRRSLYIYIYIYICSLYIIAELVMKMIVFQSCTGQEINPILNF